MSNTNNNYEYTTSSRSLRRRFVGALIVLLIFVTLMGAVTMAWYIYNTNSHTTDVHMAAGTSTRLEIAKEYDGEYSYAVQLDQFKGRLNPVSTDKITGGFQECVGHTEDTEGTRGPLAYLFDFSKKSDYYQDTMFLRTNASDLGVYVSGIDFKDTQDAQLLATALRVGLVVHEPGQDQPVAKEYIFELSDKKNPNREYNAYNGYDGCVLDHRKTDGSVVELTPYSKKNFAKYDPITDVIELTDDSLKLFDLTGTVDKDFGTPVQVDVYIWLEGCDADCTGFIGGLSLEDLAITYACFKN